MTQTVQQLLDSFDALTPYDKHQAAVEILRRYTGVARGDLTEEALVALADELFTNLDDQEAGHAPR